MQPFRFKQFTIHHDRTAMKVGTDGVLLGAWAQVSQAKTVLDIGTGCGVIALMLAQRTAPGISIDAIEPEPQAYAQACENVKASSWPEKIAVYEERIQGYRPDFQYDLIISNPPYFQNSQKPPDAQRSVTRHTDTLPFTDLMLSAKRLLTANGKFNVILPYTEGLEFMGLAREHHLYCTRQWSFRARYNKPVERWLLEFMHEELPTDTGEIVLYLHDRGEAWTPEYKRLTEAFYLKI